jgi:hypothetical protein
MARLFRDHRRDGIARGNRVDVTYLHKSQPGQDRDDFLGFENRGRHGSGDLDGLDPDELGLERGFAVLQKHRDHFANVLAQLIESLALGMSTREARHRSHVEARLGSTLDHNREGFHVFPPEAAAAWPCEATSGPSVAGRSIVLQ